jgi:NitT/TauT family transport system permease protein
MDATGLAGLIASILVNLVFSWSRMLIALGVSVLLGIAVGIYAATSKRAEKVIIPIIDIFQTLPILSFFPFVIYIFIALIPGFVGIELAVIFLITTSMLWNIIFGVYEALNSIPKEYIELADLYNLSTWRRLKKIFFPASLPYVVEQSMLSWSIGLFYLVTSEIFSAGTDACPIAGNTAGIYSVKTGIGVALTCYAATGNTLGYALGIIFFILFVIATRFLLFRPLENYANRYTRQSVQRKTTNTYLRNAAVRLFKYLEPPGTERIRVRLNRPRRQEKIIASRSASPAEKQESWRLKYVLIALALMIIAIAGVKYLVLYELEILRNFVFSILRVWIAFAVSLAISVPLCVYLIFFTKKSSSYILLFQVIASIPATILLPAIVAMMGKSPYHSEIIAFLIFIISGIWYLIFSIMSASKLLPANILEVKRIFGLKGLAAWKKVYVRAIVPGILTGGVTAIAAEWNASIVAEYYGSGVSGVSLGIGKLLDTSFASNNLPLLFLALVNLAAMVVIVNSLLWKRSYKRMSRIYR